LTPRAIGDPEDYAYSHANALFDSNVSGVDPEWRESYWEAFDASCRLSVESVDPRVFLELKIYQWSPNTRTFLYPISKDFDLQPILDKELWTDWSKLLDALPAERRDPVRELCEGCYRRIREYFVSGFTNMTELQNGDLSRLMGTWRLKLTTGTQKNEVLSFTQNAVGVPHMEAYRTSVNGYDYYRYIKVDASNRITAKEHRHFPSTAGLGGDFYTLGPDSPVMGLMAVYEYIMIMPTALYSRTDPAKIPNHARALSYIEQCKAMPCYHRAESLKNVFEVRVISENHDTGAPTKKASRCYIATAVYGDAAAPEVDRLRRFRDERLNTSRFGRRLCSLYYNVSPRFVRRLRPSGPISRLIRRVLDAFVRKLGD
jgi:hypothetical protein